MNSRLAFLALMLSLPLVLVVIVCEVTFIQLTDINTETRYITILSEKEKVPIIVLTMNPDSAKMAEFNETFSLYGDINVLMSTTPENLEGKIVWNETKSPVSEISKKSNFRREDMEVLLSVTHSHLHAIQLAHQRAYEYVWIMEDDARLDYVSEYPELRRRLKDVLSNVSSLEQDISVLYCTCRSNLEYKGIGFQEFRLSKDYGAVSYLVRVKPVLEAIKTHYCSDVPCNKWDISSSPFPVSDYILYAHTNVKVHIPNLVSHGHPFKETSLDSSIHNGEARKHHYSFIRRSHERNMNYLRKHLSVLDRLSFLKGQLAYLLEY